MKYSTKFLAFVVSTLGIAILCIGRWGVSRGEGYALTKGAPAAESDTVLPAIMFGGAHAASLSFGDWADHSPSEGEFYVFAKPLTTSDLPGDELVIDPYGFRIHRREYDPGSQNWHDSEEEYATSFPIRSLDLLGTHDLLIVGVDVNGDSVLEVWRIPPVPGEWVGEASTVSTGVGTPAAATPSRTTAIVGGQFIVPESRDPRQRPRKRQIYSGASLDVIDAFIDRDRRYVAAVARDMASNDVGIYLIDTSVQVSQPVLLYGSSLYPSLERAYSIAGCLYGPLGRCYVLDLDMGATAVQTDPDVFIAWDLDNDGLSEVGEAFESWMMWATYPESNWNYAVMWD